MIADWTVLPAKNEQSKPKEDPAQADRGRALTT